MHPHRILSLLFLLLLSLALGACASHDARPAPEPGAPLPAVTLEQDDRVFVQIENGKDRSKELRSMLLFCLQNERGIKPAPSIEEADLVILVEIRGIWANSDDSYGAAGQALGNVSTGTMLGVLLGGLVDGRTGAIVGAGIGATVGVGATLYAADAISTSWGMEAAVGTAARRLPDRTSLVPVTVISEGSPRSRAKASPGLEDALCRAILESIRS